MRKADKEHAVEVHIVDPCNDNLVSVQLLWHYSTRYVRCAWTSAKELCSAKFPSMLANLGCTQMIQSSSLEGLWYMKKLGFHQMQLLFAHLGRIFKVSNGHRGSNCVSNSTL
jgi:hypothetical protein